MKSDRRIKQQQVSDALAKEIGGVPEMLKRWGNTALTALLIVLAIVMLVRWRLASVEQARQAVLNSLSNARNYVQQLRPDEFRRELGGSPQLLAQARSDIMARASGEIASVLNSTDDPSLKAQAALITRGDLYWQLANFPDLPGAATQPSLRFNESREDLLKRSADAYNEVLKTDAYAKQHDLVVSAHFGLAAIAENRRDWDTARTELQTIAKDGAALPALAKQASDELVKLPEMQTPLYLAPATQAAAEPSLDSESPLPTTLPTIPTTVPTIQPTTQP